MTVREVVETAQTGSTKIKVTGSYKHGLVDLYTGDIESLRIIYKINDILNKKNWGGINKENCFLLRDVNSLSGGDGLWISVDMPDSYKHEDKDGNRLSDIL